MDELREKALTATHSAVEAATELARYAREGADLRHTFSPHVEPIEKLLDAAKMAMEVETLDLEADAEFVASRKRVYDAICEHLEGWA